MPRNYIGPNAGSHLYNMVGRIFTARVTENEQHLRNLSNRCGEVINQVGWDGNDRLATDFRSVTVADAWMILKAFAQRDDDSIQRSPAGRSFSRDITSDTFQDEALALVVLCLIQNLLPELTNELLKKEFAHLGDAEDQSTAVFLAPPRLVNLEDVLNIDEDYSKRRKSALPLILAA